MFFIKITHHFLIRSFVSLKEEIKKKLVYVFPVNNRSRIFTMSCKIIIRLIGDIREGGANMNVIYILIN